MDYRVCDVCQMRVPQNLYDVHMLITHARAPDASHASHASQPTNSAAYDPFSSLIDFSALLMELRQHQAAQVNDNSTTTFPPLSMQQPPSAPAVFGISRLLELYSSIPTSPTPSTNANFLHNFDTISSNTSTPNLPSYRDVVEQQHEQQSQSISSSAFYANQRDANILNVPPITSTFQYMSYSFNPATQGFDYTSNTPQQPQWFSTDPPTPPRQRQSNSQSPFNLTRLGPIALEMLAAFDESSFFDNYENNIRLAERVGVVEVGIDNIDTVSSVIPKEEVNSDDICTICLDKMIDKRNEHVRKLICSHIYCDGCITQWLAKNKKCPVCNVDLEDKLNELNSAHT